MLELTVNNSYFIQKLRSKTFMCIDSCRSLFLNLFGLGERIIDFRASKNAAILQLRNLLTAFVFKRVKGSYSLSNYYPHEVSLSKSHVEPFVRYVVALMVEWHATHSSKAQYKLTKEISIVQPVYN